MTKNMDKVTLRDVYEAVDSLRKEVGGHIDKLEDRVDRNDEKISKIYGGVGVISVIFGTIAGIITDRIFKQ